MTQHTEQVREEFNRWAAAGRGAEMEDSHRPITDPTLALMNIQPADRVLDVGCGTGWLCRQMASIAHEGAVAGIDLSDEMIAEAQRSAAAFANLQFRIGGAEQVPWADGSFTKIISVESAYYWPHPARGVTEIFRVLDLGGSAWILINFYRDNPYCRQWSRELKVPVVLLSAREWSALFEDAGFTQVVHRCVPDRSPSPDVYTGGWFRDADEMRKFKQEGALLLSGIKP